jgi:hypothetical protein
LLDRVRVRHFLSLESGRLAADPSAVGAQPRLLSGFVQSCAKRSQGALHPPAGRHLALARLLWDPWSCSQTGPPPSQCHGEMLRDEVVDRDCPAAGAVSLRVAPLCAPYWLATGCSIRRAGRLAGHRRGGNQPRRESWADPELLWVVAEGIAGAGAAEGYVGVVRSILEGCRS